MRKLLGFFLLFVLLLPVSVQAQGTVRFSTVEVEIWPEYDKPDVLIIYRLSLASDVDLPVDLIIRIPGQAEINAVATSDATGALITAEYTPQTDEDWISIALSTSSSQVQIEYYAPLTKQEADRRYTFLWPSDYAVDDFNVYFKLPIDATDLQSQPTLNPLGTGSDQLAYYGLENVALDTGEVFTLSLEYQKTTDRLSTSDMGVEPVEDLGTGISGFNLREYLPWILGGLGLVLIIAGVVYFVSTRRSHRGSLGRKRHAANRTEDVAMASGAIYCHQCGRRAQPSDRFCRACGTRLRRDE